MCLITTGFAKREKIIVAKGDYSDREKFHGMMGEIEGLFRRGELSRADLLGIAKTFTYNKVWTIETVDKRIRAMALNGQMDIVTVNGRGYLLYRNELGGLLEFGLGRFEIEQSLSIGKGQMILASAAAFSDYMSALNEPMEVPVVVQMHGEPGAWTYDGTPWKNIQVVKNLPPRILPCLSVRPSAPPQEAVATL